MHLNCDCVFTVLSLYFTVVHCVFIVFSLCFHCVFILFSEKMQIVIFFLVLFHLARPLQSSPKKEQQPSQKITGHQVLKGEKEE